MAQSKTAPCITDRPAAALSIATKRDHGAALLALAETGGQDDANQRTATWTIDRAIDRRGT